MATSATLTWRTTFVGQSASQGTVPRIPANCFARTFCRRSVFRRPRSPSGSASPGPGSTPLSARRLPSPRRWRSALPVLSAAMPRSGLACSVPTTCGRSKPRGPTISPRSSRSQPEADLDSARLSEYASARASARRLLRRLSKGIGPGEFVLGGARIFLPENIPVSGRLPALPVFEASFGQLEPCGSGPFIGAPPARAAPRCSALR